MLDKNDFCVKGLEVFIPKFYVGAQMIMYLLRAVYGYHVGI